MSILYRGLEVGSFPAQRKEATTFKIGDCGVCKRAKKIKQLVLHWTAGEGSSSSCFTTLQHRGLSVQFYMDQQGGVYQYCDMDYVCSHAGFVNGYSVGIEIANNGVPPARDKFPRSIIKTKLKGQERSLLAFYSTQVNSTVSWCKELCRILSIPTKLLRDADGNILTTTADKKTITDFSGVLAHYQISDHKIDPGTQLLEALNVAGFK